MFFLICLIKTWLRLFQKELDDNGINIILGERIDEILRREG